jgi:hypothetical protein
MSLPTKSDLYTLGLYILQGQPFTSIAGKSTIDSRTLSVVFQGEPIYVIGGADAPSGGGAAAIHQFIIAT